MRSVEYLGRTGCSIGLSGKNARRKGLACLAPMSFRRPFRGRSCGRLLSAARVPVRIMTLFLDARRVQARPQIGGAGRLPLR